MNAPKPSLPPTTPSRWRASLVRRVKSAVGKTVCLPIGLRQLIHTPARWASQGFAIGLMRPVDLDQWVEDAYENATYFYDPRKYELPHDQAMLPTLNRLAGGKRLLDAFCGQGREAELLSDAGFSVTGIDRQRSMIDGAKRYASERGFAAEFQQADFDTYQADSPYDVVYTSCWMYSTVQGRARRINFVNQCGALCKTDGLVVFSVDHRTGAFVPNLVRHLIARITAWLTLGNRECEWGEQIAYSELFWHCHSEASVRRELDASNLEIVEVLPGDQEQPMFFFLRPRPTSDHDSQRGKNVAQRTTQPLQAV